jgi:isocitrate dehydrogenase (NAD+)
MLGGALMLSHMGMEDKAARLRDAIRETIASGDRVTPDLGGDGTTSSFTDAISDRINA